MVVEIKRLDANVREFSTAETTYLVHYDLTGTGLEKLDLLRVQMETGASVIDIINGNRKAYALLDQGKVATAAVVLYNAISAGELIEEGTPQPWLLSLTLFARPKGSDLTVWDEAEAISWINDWLGDGYSVTDLFNLAAVCQKAFVAGFTANSLTSSEKSESENPAE